MAVGVYGHLPALNPSAAQADHDSYSVFHGLNSALGLVSDPAADTPDTGLWGMNDAGGPWASADPTALCGWFQVGPPYDSLGPLPVTPLAATAVATITRFGGFTLSGLEFYVPLWCAGSAHRRLLEGRSWFAPTDPARRASLRVTLESRTGHVVAERADELLDALGILCPPGAIFRFESADARTDVDFASPVPWRWWLGDGASHTVTLAATAPEWTPIALGYTVAYASEACRAIGITTAIGVRINRA